MWRSVYFVGFICCCSHIPILSQQMRQFAVQKVDGVEKIFLKLTGTSGTCNLKPSSNEEILYLKGNTENENFTPISYSKRHDQIYQINLNLKENKSVGIGEQLSDQMFGSDKKSWDIYLSKNNPYPYILNLDYCVGQAEIDLSDVSVEKLRINTGSTSIKIGYQDNMPNKVDMDTFFVEVDLGTLEAQNINLSRAKYVIAEVGFGKLYINFDESYKNNCNVIASVGAGSLEVIIPSENTPMRIYINNSPLCHIKMAECFKEVEDHTYTNSAYNENNADEALLFNVDVAMGNISFITSK